MTCTLCFSQFNCVIINGLHSLVTMVYEEQDEL